VIDGPEVIHRVCNATSDQAGHKDRACVLLRIDEVVRIKDGSRLCKSNVRCQQ
jgi:hypothetical protein